MTSTTTIITILSIAIFALGYSSCNAQQKEVTHTEGTVKKVAYADKILLHMHPEKVLNYLPDLKDEQIAYLFGMSLEEYKTAKKVYAEEVRETVSKLLTNSDFANKIDKLPFKKEETILVIGESTADALNSWVYILQGLLNERRPQDKIKVINAAISGQTTTEALRRIVTQIKQKPDWVICHLGANDCIRYGKESNKTSVVISETMANLKTIREIIASQTKANFIWIAPTTVNEEKASFFPPFKDMQLHLMNSDILAIGDSLKKIPEMIIDFREEFGVPAKPEYVQYDGVHLNIEGQKIIIQKFINTISKTF